MQDKDRAPGCAARRPPRPLARALLLGALWLTALPAQAAGATTVFKCKVDGRVVFQQTPCANAGDAPPLDVPPVNTVEALRAPPAEPGPEATGGAAPALPVGPAALPPSALEAEAELCLEHLRPLLRDPRSAYVSEPGKRGRVLSLTLHASNPRGGIVTRPAACEIFNGRVDPRWTRTHLERLGWFQQRMVLPGRGARVEALRIELEDIEAPPKER